MLSLFRVNTAHTQETRSEKLDRLIKSSKEKCLEGACIVARIQKEAEVYSSQRS